MGTYDRAPFRNMLLKVWFNVYSLLKGTLNATP